MAQKNLSRKKQQQQDSCLADWYPETSRRLGLVEKDIVKIKRSNIQIKALEEEVKRIKDVLIALNDFFALISSVEGVEVTITSKKVKR